MVLKIDWKLVKIWLETHQISNLRWILVNNWPTKFGVKCGRNWPNLAIQNQLIIKNGSTKIWIKPTNNFNFQTGQNNINNDAKDAKDAPPLLNVRRGNGNQIKSNSFN